MEGISGADLAQIEAVIAGTLVLGIILGGLILYVLARLVTSLVSKQVSLITQNLPMGNTDNREAGLASDKAPVATVPSDGQGRGVTR